MARLYTNYLNNGREGCTWASLVATALDCANTEWATCRQIADDIWGAGPGPVPPSLTSQVNAALDKLIDNKLVAYRKNQGQPDGSRWEYSLTDAGMIRFTVGSEADWRAKDHSDSELFQPARKPKKARRNNIVRFRKVG
jgi:hypothetical protein